MQLAFVGKYDVDNTFPDEVKKLRAIAIDTKSIRQCQRDAAAGLVRDSRRLDEGFFRLWRIPQITFEVSHGGVRYLRFVDVARLQVLRGAEIVFMVRSPSGVTMM